jgi:5-methyltetrahydrofolate--homocysteine methyltransferase
MKYQQLKEILDKRFLVLDGSVGTRIQNILANKVNVNPPDRLNLEDAKVILQIHKEYVEAGADVILTNTFGASSIKLSDYNLQSKGREINKEGVRIAREAAKGRAFVAGCIGSTGKFIKPIGDLDFNDALESFSLQVEALVSESPDMLIIETISDIRELKAALMACRRYFDGVVIAQMTFMEDGRTITGTDPISFGVVATALKADVVGVNCSLGPEQILPIIKILAETFPNPISIEPNAGLPMLIDGKAVFEYSPEMFQEYSLKFADLGVSMIGGCCGTTPLHIQKIADALKNKKPKQRNISKKSFLSSRSKTVIIDEFSPTRIIGERINPTARKKLQSELLNNDYSTIRMEAIEQVEKGADILDINVGVPGVDEISLMQNIVNLVQTTVNAPISLDSVNPAVLLAGIEEIEGKCLINSTNGEDRNLENIIPIAAKYGASIIGLTIDEKGIPNTTAERIRIAKKIIKIALKNGIPREDIFIDFLTLTISAAQDQAKETLEAIPIIKKEFGVKTILGVSNISYGLPSRDSINAAFLAMAITKGLDVAIINPMKEEVAKSLQISDLILGKEKDLIKFSKIHQEKKDEGSKIIKPERKLTVPELLYSAILTGAKDSIISNIENALKEGLNPIDINNQYLIPAMTEVGRRFKEKEFFLPQVLMSAETMKIALNRLKQEMSRDNQIKQRGLIILSTVKGDIHDIGKNIVGAVLQSRGYNIVDLGKDVDFDLILKSLDCNPDVNLIGLSALMTTTMGEMSVIIENMDKESIKIPVIVGGAVVTGRYANSIGASGYAKDAIDAIALCDQLIHPIA